MDIQYRGTDRNGDGVYEIRVYCGYKNGKRIRKTKIIHAKSERAAKKQAEKLLAEGKLQTGGKRALSENLTFIQFTEIWKERHGARLARRTKINAQSILDRYILVMFSGKKLSKIGVEDIRLFIRWLRSQEVYRATTGQSTPLSDTMIHKCYKLLAHMLRKAAEWHYIAVNPCEELEREEIPRPDYHHAPIWQPEELAVFLRYIDGLPQTYANLQKRVMFYTILITGLRKGEAAVLTWRDVNLGEKSITVNKSLKYMDSNEVDIAGPKTKGSKRKVFFDDFTLSLFQKLQVAQKEYLEQLHKENPEKLVFISQRVKTGDIIPVTPSYLYIWLRDAAKICNLPHIDVHSVRHMAATYALASGAPITGVQNMMGHTSLRTTSIYIHMLDEQRKQAANVLSAQLAAIRNKK